MFLIAVLFKIISYFFEIVPRIFNNQEIFDNIAEFI